MSLAQRSSTKWRDFGVNVVENDWVGHSGHTRGRDMPGSKSKRLVFVDAFAGCGGLSLGLMQAGLTGRFAIEHDRFAFATLQANLLSRGAKFRFNWPRWLPKEPQPIEAVLGKHGRQLRQLQGSIDVLVGGPPCQGFSTAGRREHDDPRNRLFASYLKLVECLRPKIVLIENVRGFTMDFEQASKNYAALVRDELSNAYEVYDQLLDLSKFGVPQARTRYFLLALRKGLTAENPFELLAKRLPSFLRKLGLTAPISAWAAISDLETARGGTRPSSETVGFEEIAYAGPRNSYQRLMSNGAAAPGDLRLARHSPEITARFGKLIRLSHAEGRLNRSISSKTRSRLGIRKQALRVLDPDRPSPTITSMPDDLLHYSEPRTLTVRENARLQSFPDWFSFKGKYTTGGKLRKREVPRFTQVANAVPPLVSRAIGEMIMELLLDKPKRRGSSSASLSLQRINQSTEIVPHA
ncbi:DNA cytosine methyltransferase [Bradyrhizobium lupini]